MATQSLRNIHAFPELVRYLEDELDWPLQEYGFDELTFEFTPAELGLKEEDATRIKAIHQLRPLASGQPWGIFFVEFENKKLPVVVLRRILSHLVLKKRASANKANAPAWHAEDLLFVTAFGEESADTREIAFAHFHQNPGDMPTLHVLGWDGGDTPLKLANIDHVLHERLRWPEDESDADAWRDAWRKPFKHRIGHVIQTADLLAEELAKLARGIRDKAKRMLAAETDRGALTKLYKAFQTALIHDLTPESFADTYAQTITYGLLTAAISRTEMSAGRHGTALVAENVVDMVPVTNPFLKEMLQTFLKAGGRKGGIDFDELGIQDVVELLRGDETDLPAILRDFGNRTRGEDPVIHFYEHFLSTYNKQLKIQRGVFYTPQPVVSYIVRSVHELLQTEFGLADGLADTTTWGEMLKKHSGLKLPPLTDEPGEKRTISPDEPFVQILDPATGTATFLVEVIDVIHRTMVAKWKKQGFNEAARGIAWNDYVPKHLLPRLHAYELMMAPYAIAHMKIGLKLKETGYRFSTEERARIYLTNALEPWVKQLPLIGFEALAHEAAAVNEIKRHKRFTVVIGNPPYSISSQNTGSWITGLVESYKIAVRHERNIQPLSDDYVKFFRIGQHAVDTTNTGILAYISNHTFLSGLIHRGMRKELRKSFNRIAALDLNGSTLLGLEISPDGRQDQNVFDIQQGVAITISRSSLPAAGSGNVQFSSIRANRTTKYTFLSISSCVQGEFATLLPFPPNHFFVPMAQRDLTYDSWPKLDDIFGKQSTGMETGRDETLIDFDRATMQAFCADLHSKSFSAAQLANTYSISDTSGWPVSSRRKDIQGKPLKKLIDSIRFVQYRPFDKRFTIYGSFLRRAQFENMRHMLTPNLGLIATRMIKGEEPAHFYIAREPIEKILISPKTSNNAFLFPLYITEEDADAGATLDFDADRVINLRREFLNKLCSALKVKPTGSFGVPAGLTPENIFHYIYAVFHSPTYRSRYAEFLKIDFPRLPLTGNLELFRALARLGGELVALHLLESPKINTFITRFEGKGDNSIPKKPIYKDGAVWINASQRFEGVPEAVWNFHIGGYQVCEKWLKDRKGRTLSADDIAHYQRVVVALSETISLMAEIDRVIETHGGWPGAFQTTDVAAASA